MTPKSSEQNLKSTRLALRIQSILSSTHGDLIPSSAPPSFRKPYTSFVFVCFLCVFSVPSVLFLRFSVLFLRFLCFLRFLYFCALLCVSLCLAPLFISRPVHRLESQGAGASEFRWFFAFP